MIDDYGPRDAPIFEPEEKDQGNLKQNLIRVIGLIAGGGAGSGASQGAAGSAASGAGAAGAAGAGTAASSGAGSALSKIAEGAKQVKSYAPGAVNKPLTQLQPQEIQQGQSQTGSNNYQQLMDYLKSRSI